MIFCWKLKTHISSLPGKNFITKIPFPQPIRMRMISSIRQFLLNKIGLTKIKWQSYFKLMIRNGPKPKLLICSQCKCFFTLNAYPINILKARLQTWSESALMCWSFYAALYSVLCTHNVFVYLFEYPRHLLAIVSHTRLPEFTSKERWRLILDDVNIMTVPLMIYKTQWQAETWLRNTRTAGAISSAWYPEKNQACSKTIL